MKISGEQLFDPWKKERVATTLAPNPKVVSALGTKLISEVFTKNRAAGKAKPFLVCGINRDKPQIHAWLDLSTTINEEIRPAYPEKDYAGALSHAETLLTGEWYIASPEEEKACHEKDMKDRERALAHATQEKVGEANKLIGEIFKAAASQVKAADETKEAEQSTSMVGAGPSSLNKKRSA
jgi:hypothetical protein